MSVLIGIVMLSSLAVISSSSGNRLQGQYSTGFDPARNLPKSISKKIMTTSKELEGEAHILRPVSLTDSFSGIQLSFDLTSLPFYLQDIFIMDELYLQFKSTPNVDTSTTVPPDLWIADASSKTSLARVSLATKTGYQRVILGKWSKSQQSSVLSIEVRPGPLMASDVLGSNPLAYLVVYTTRLMNPQGGIPQPKPVHCYSHTITVPTSDAMLPRRLRTKVCSPLKDLTFPFPASPEFDVGQVVRKHLISYPIPGNSKVRGNPTCCHAVQATSVTFLVLGQGVFSFENANITECGCQNP